jgi:hypothetical protein
VAPAPKIRGAEVAGRGEIAAPGASYESDSWKFALKNPISMGEEVINAMEQTFRIYRFYKDEKCKRQILKTGLTLEEAQAHCNGPESRWNSCTTEEGHALTAKCGPWFDGYDEDFVMY